MQKKKNEKKCRDKIESKSKIIRNLTTQKK